MLWPDPLRSSSSMTRSTATTCYWGTGNPNNPSLPTTSAPSMTAPRTSWVSLSLSSSTLAAEHSPPPPCTSLGLSTPTASPPPTTPLSPLLSTFLASVLYNLWLATNAKDLHSLPTLDFPNLPRSPSFKQDHLPSVWRLYNESKPETHFIKDGKILRKFYKP